MDKEIIILTGPSGAGLSSAKFVFEELGYYIVDNFPGEAIDSLLDSFNHRLAKYKKYCLIVDLHDAEDILNIIKTKEDFKSTLILLNADRETIIKRYTLTRHMHPQTMLRHLTLEEAINQDLIKATELSDKADFVLDSSALTVKELRHYLLDFLRPSEKDVMHVTFVSFGLKNGVPRILDTLIDTRYIPNPFWVDSLKELTGEDQPVIDYMMSFPQTKAYLEENIKYLSFVLKSASEIGRAAYVVGVACSGGQHRSTFVANYLAEHFAKEYKTSVMHRDTPRLNKINDEK